MAGGDPSPTVQSDLPIRFMNFNLKAEPWMPSIRQFPKLGCVAVLKACRTPTNGRTVT
jgi:hypothetical protein